MKTAAFFRFTIGFLFWMLVSKTEAQTPCDTIYLIDSTRVPGNIKKSEEKGVTKELVGRSATLKRTPNKYRHTFWVGALPLGFAYIDPERYLVQFGMDFTLKKVPNNSITIYFSPFIREYTGQENFKSAGLNGEVEVALKRFSINRLNGAHRPFYTGLAFRFIRQEYSFTKNHEPYSIQSDWKQLMFNLGFEFHLKRLAIDLKLPVGYYWNSFETTSPMEEPVHKAIDFLMIMPGLSLGYRFR